MNCSWCGLREVEFELIIYHIEKQIETIANRLNKQIQYLKGDKYLTVRLCEKCLPCVATENPLRYRLHGKK